MSDEILTLEPAADAEPAPGAPAWPDVPFKLVARDVITRSRHRTSPLVPIQRGDVAVVDGRLVARWWTGQGVAYAALAPDADLAHAIDREHPRDFDIAPDVSVVDPFGHIAAATDTATSPHRWPTLDPETSADREIKAFVSQWPAVAALLGVENVEVYRLFRPGRVRHGGGRPTDGAAMASIDWREYLRRHETGDWGDHGRHDEAPLTTGQVWALGLQPVEVQNRHAVATGNGWIRSRYHLPDAVQAQFPALPGVRRRAAVEVMTGLAGNHAETLMTVTFLPAEASGPRLHT